jgi:hypothetical protein
MVDVLTETESGPSENGSTARAEEPRRGRKPLTPQQKKILGVALVLHVIVYSFTLRDLRRRPQAAVRGPKVLWRVAAGINTSGSVAYWLFGRRARPQPIS